MLKKIAIGAGVGLVVGSVAGMVRAVGAVIPLTWPVSGALAIGGIVHQIARENGVAKGEIGPAVLGGAAGLVMGAACIPFAPIVTPIMLVQAACLPAVGMVGGGVIGALSK